MFCRARVLGGEVLDWTQSSLAIINVRLWVLLGNCGRPSKLGFNLFIYFNYMFAQNKLLSARSKRFCGAPLASPKRWTTVQRVVGGRREVECGDHYDTLFAVAVSLMICPFASSFIVPGTVDRGGKRIRRGRGGVGTTISGHFTE